MRLDAGALEHALEGLVLLLLSLAELWGTLELAVGVVRRSCKWRQGTHAVSMNPLPMIDTASRLRAPHPDSLLADLLDVDLIWAVGVSEGTDAGPESGKRGVLVDALGTVHLHGSVDDLEGHGWDDGLGHTNLTHRTLGADGVDL